MDARGLRETLILLAAACDTRARAELESFRWSADGSRVARALCNGSNGDEESRKAARMVVRQWLASLNVGWDGREPIGVAVVRCLSQSAPTVAVDDGGSRVAIAGQVAAALVQAWRREDPGMRVNALSVASEAVRIADALLEHLKETEQ